MNIDTLVTIISSAFVSLLASIGTISLLLGQYKQKVDSLEKNLDKTVENHGLKLDVISDRLARLEGGVDRDRSLAPYVQSRSPLSLTDQGKLAFFESGGKKYLDEHLVVLIKAIKAEKPKTAYDVQVLSKKVIEEKQNEDAFNPLKDYAFQKGLNIDILINIMGIALRDEALTQLGFEIDDVDKSDPEKQ